MSKRHDPVNRPAHYCALTLEAIDVVEDWGLGPGFCLGNAVKYLLRHRRKENGLQDLQKARWYLHRASEYNTWINRGQHRIAAWQPALEFVSPSLVKLALERIASATTQRDAVLFNLEVTRALAFVDEEIARLERDAQSAPLPAPVEVRLPAAGSFGG